MNKLSLITIATTLALAGQAHAGTLLSKGASKTGSFGDSQFAAGYTAGARLTYSTAGGAGMTGDALESTAYAKGWVRLMGTKNDVVEVRADGSSIVDGTQALEVAVWARVPFLGTKLPIYTQKISSTISVSKTFSPTLMSASGWFWAGPIPVHATARAVGTIGFSASGTVSPTGINVSFTPRAGANGYLSAEVDVLFASAGVYGSLNLLDAKLPTTGKLLLNTAAGQCAGVHWDLDTDLNVYSLDGEFGVKASLFGETWKAKVFGWDGFSTTYALYDQAGTLCL